MAKKEILNYFLAYYLTNFLTYYSFNFVMKLIKYHNIEDSNII